MRDPAFSPFGTIPACDRKRDGRTDRQTDRQAHDDSIYRASTASRSKNVIIYIKIMLAVVDKADFLHTRGTAAYRQYIKALCKVIWQKAASPTCHPSGPSRLRMDSSGADSLLIHVPWTHVSQCPNGTSIASAVFVGLAFLPKTAKSYALH